MEEPKESDLYRIGCVATVKQIVKLPGNMKRVLVSGEQRAGLSWIESEEPYFQVAVKYCRISANRKTGNCWKIQSMKKEWYVDFVNCSGIICQKSPKLAKELAMMIEEIKSLRVMVDTIAANLPMDYRRYPKSSGRAGYSSEI